jgi:hypothetical protein
VLAVRAQAEGDRLRAQAMVGRIEIDGAQRAGDGLAGTERAECWKFAYALLFLVGKLELQLQLTTPGNAHCEPLNATGKNCRKG